MLASVVWGCPANRNSPNGIARFESRLGGLDREHPAEQHAKHETEKAHGRPVGAVRAERANIAFRDAGVFGSRHDGPPAIATGWTLPAVANELGGIA